MIKYIKAYFLNAKSLIVLSTFSCGINMSPGMLSPDFLASSSARRTDIGLDTSSLPLNLDVNPFISDINLSTFEIAGISVVEVVSS